MHGDNSMLSPARKQVTESSSDWSHKKKMLLVANVQDDPHSVESWYALLNAAEEDPEILDGPSETLLRLYAQATRVLPCDVNVDNELYLRIWIGYAEQQMKVNIEDALETFKFLESRNIGDHFALRYTEWAKAELHAGYRTKALQVLKKGLTLRAMPICELHRQFLDIIAADKAKSDIGTEGRIGQGSSPSERTLQKHETLVPSLVTNNHSSSSSDTAGSLGTQEMVNNLSSTITKEDANGHSGTVLHNPRRFPKRVKPLGPPLRVALGEKGQTGGTEGSNLQEAELEGANQLGEGLEGVNVQGVGQEGANLQGAGLEGANLQGAGPEVANLQAAGPEGANLQGAGPGRADLQGGRPEEANLQRAGPEVAHLQGTGQEGASSQGAGPSSTRQPLKDRNMNRPEVKAGTVSLPRKHHENESLVVVNNRRYQKLGKIGSGGSSDVFKVIDADCTIYALKRIHLRGKDHMSASSFYQEIDYLERLRGKRHIVQMVDYEVTNKNVLERGSSAGRDKIEEDSTIYMVLEYGEIDLAGMLTEKRKATADLDDNWLRLYWQHVLEAVETIHKERIVHSDLKPANFLLVKGELKLIDFGIAKAIQNDTTNIVRENQMGTVNYMSPEALMQNSVDESGELVKVGRASDIWSLGCILYQMVYGQTPFSHLSFYAKFKEITNPKHKINFPAISNYWLMDAMKRCLCWDPHKRLRIPDLLVHPFLRPDLAPKPAIPRSPGGGIEVQQLIVEVQRISAADVSEFKSHVLRLLFSRLNGLHGS